MTNKNIGGCVLSAQPDQVQFLSFREKIIDPTPIDK